MQMKQTSGRRKPRSQILGVVSMKGRLERLHRLDAPAPPAMTVFNAQDSIAIAAYPSHFLVC
jgi:hypothetical protein